MTKFRAHLVLSRAFGPAVDRLRGASPNVPFTRGFWSRRFNLDPRWLTTILLAEAWLGARSLAQSVRPKDFLHARGFTR
jgi:hypothetical protein